MKHLLHIVAVLFVLVGCSQEPIPVEETPVFIHGEWNGQAVTVRLIDVQMVRRFAPDSDYIYIHSDKWFTEVTVYDKKEIEKVSKYFGKDYSSMPTKNK